MVECENKVKDQNGSRAYRVPFLDHLSMSHGSPFWVLVQMLKQGMLQT